MYLVEFYRIYGGNNLPFNIFDIFSRVRGRGGKPATSPPSFQETEKQNEEHEKELEDLRRQLSVMEAIVRPRDLPWLKELYSKIL